MNGVMPKPEQENSPENQRDDFERRILQVTIELAVEGGYDAVRQREVAARAGVALSTLYARFEGKNSLLAAALELEWERQLDHIREQPLRGRTPLSRVTRLFQLLTQDALKQPLLARAALHATTSGEGPAMQRLARLQFGYIEQAVKALRGSPRSPAMDEDAATRVATILVMVWFANLTGWAGGLLDEGAVVDVMRQAAEMLLHGVLNTSST